MSGPPPVRPGLCGSCRHARTLTNNRGSTFWLCEAHTRHPELQKYPELPVLTCPVYRATPDHKPGPEPGKAKG